VSAGTDRSDELLRRARELEARAGEAKTAAEESAARSGGERSGYGVDDLAWLARAIRRVRQIFAEAKQVLEQVARYTGPLRPVGRGLWRATKFAAHRSSHVRRAEGTFEFSPRKTARSLLALAAAPVLLYSVYNATTRHGGVFLINDKHLVSGDTDEYQMGGCWQTMVGRRSCEKGEGVIVLIRPAWIPGTGIFSATYDEDVGLIPLQGKCELRTYGIYLRLPWMPFLRGALKPVAIGIGQCEGIAAATGPPPAVGTEGAR
jgi:hypothetical protein